MLVAGGIEGDVGGVLPHSVMFSDGGDKLEPPGMRVNVVPSTVMLA